MMLVSRNNDGSVRRLWWRDGELPHASQEWLAMRYRHWLLWMEEVSAMKRQRHFTRLRATLRDNSAFLVNYEKAGWAISEAHRIVNDYLAGFR